MALGSIQLLTEMSTMNLLGGKDGRRVKLTTSPPLMSQLSIIYGRLDCLLQRYNYFLAVFRRSSLNAEGICLDRAT
jgi:hypothetical protein